MQVIDTPQQRQSFMRHVLADLDALEVLLASDRFERGVRRVGLEQELNLVDRHWRPALVADRVKAEARKAGLDNVVSEYARFNLEINLPPTAFDANVLRNVREKLGGDLATLADAARKHEAKLALVGILPSIRREDIGPEALTPEPRYRMLFGKTQQQKGGRDYEYHIEGLDELHTRDDVSVFGGCFTSMQLHWQVDPDDAGRAFNWAQLLAGPQLACAVNAPIFLGKRLWQETRVALFEQTSDFRRRHESDGHEPPRVTFGADWCRDGVIEVFREDVARHRAYMQCDPDECEEDPVEQVQNGKLPSLKALQFHNGTIYRWNRPCIGTSGLGHVRIENRVLAAGPTLADELANAAFWWGLMAALPDLPEAYHDLPDRMDFDDAHRNFLGAARVGLDVQFHWPTAGSRNGGVIPAQELILDELLPIARQGLASGGVADEEIEHHLGVLRRRVETGKTGARWILDSYEALRTEASDDEALIETTAGLVHRQEEDTPVHDWTPAKPDEAGDWRTRFARVDQAMSHDVYTVRADDVLDLAAHLIRWRKLGHLCVVDDAGRLEGLVSSEVLVGAVARGTTAGMKEMAVRDVMLRDPVSVSADTPLKQAIDLMREKDLSCLPVLRDGKLAGLVKEADLVRVLDEILHDELGRSGS